MFAVVISEKGGAERREIFHGDEISVGRVQGNDLMLPKGNVSKRHAQLAQREGRFVVTDQNSTNGTYVNRRRISQATIVRHGDRIYIGDFVLRIEIADPSEAPSAKPPPQRPEPPFPLEPRHTQAVKEDPEQPSHAYPLVPKAPRLPGRVEPPASGGPPQTEERPPSTQDRAPSTREESIDAETVAFRSALLMVVDRVTAKLDPRALDRDVNEALVLRVDELLTEQLEVLRREGLLTARVPESKLMDLARLELLELGPLTALVHDETVTEIAVNGTHGLAASRGERRSYVDPPFSSDASLLRAVRRLASKSGVQVDPGERVFERRLAGGWKLHAVVGAAAPDGGLVVMRRSRLINSSLEELVRVGTISRAMATFLRHCVAARTNILVVGARDAGTSAMLSALAASSREGHVVALQSEDQLAANRLNVTHLNLDQIDAEPQRLLEVASAMPDARILIEKFSGRIAAATLDAIGDGVDGVIAAVRAPSIRRGVARLPADLAASKSGLGLQAMREWIASSFDVAIEVARLRDGRVRALRVCELGMSGGSVQLDDIFTFIVERTATGGSVEGTFNAAGTAPRILEDLRLRGATIDSALFTRPPSG